MSVRLRRTRFAAVALPTLALLALAGCSEDTGGTGEGVTAGTTDPTSTTGTGSSTTEPPGPVGTPAATDPGSGATGPGATGTDGDPPAVTGSGTGTGTSAPTMQGTDPGPEMTSAPTTPATDGSGGAGAGAGGTASSGGAGPGPGGSSGSGGSAAGTGGAMETAGAGGSAGGSQSGGGAVDGYNEDFEEFVGEDCELPEPALLSSPSHSLPDPFLMADGTRMSSVSQWACQRAWLKKNLAAFVHGEKPGRPEVVSGSVSGSGISVHVEDGGGSADFMIPIDLPPGANGPVPGVFQADGSGVPTNFLHGEGVAAMSYSHSAAESAFNSLYGGNGVADPIKWAWMVSRAIDVLVDERDAGNNDIIDPTGLGTTGCSYAGKSAFIVGAYDERIALGIPVESGTGGLGSYRVVADMDLGPNGGENPEQVSEACGQGWLTSNVCSGNVDAIPADAHFLVAMYAPRGFTTLDNNRIGHLGPVAQFTSAAAGAEVFKALGVETHVGYHGGNDDDPHNHCSFNQSQQETARFAIQGFLTKTIEPANFMEPKLKDQSDQPVNFVLSDYIDWETPMLE